MANKASVKTKKVTKKSKKVPVASNDVMGGLFPPMAPDLKTSGKKKAKSTINNFLKTGNTPIKKGAKSC